MKYYGDIPKDHLKLVEELQELEKWFNDYGSGIPMLDVAKGFVCMAYDYYSIFFDEEGERLLKAADKYCPGYFTDPIISHYTKDMEFALLISRIKKTPALDIMKSFGFEDE